MVWKSDAPTTLELSLCSGSEGSPWSLAPKPLLPPLSKLPCELADFPLELLGFLTLKYMLFVSPLKFSPLLLETQCLYNFSQLFSRNSSPGRLPALSEPFLLQSCTQGMRCTWSSWWDVWEGSRSSCSWPQSQH